MTNTKKLTKKKPSKDLWDAIHNMIGSFQKTATSIERVFSIGKREGFTDTEIGDMIRKEMLAAGYNPRTIRRALPLSSKQAQKTRKDFLDEDKMSSSTHEYRAHSKSAYKSVNNSHQELATKELVTEQQSNQLPIEQLQIVQGIEENDTIFGKARISTLPEDNNLLRFEIPIPRVNFWQYIEDHIGENHDNQFWINGVLNQETREILSLTFGRNGIH